MTISMLWDAYEQNILIILLYYKYLSKKKSNVLFIPNAFLNTLKEYTQEGVP